MHATSTVDCAWLQLKCLILLANCRVAVCRPSRVSNNGGQCDVPEFIDSPLLPWPLTDQPSYFVDTTNDRATVSSLSFTFSHRRSFAPVTNVYSLPAQTGIQVSALTLVMTSLACGDW